MSDSCNPMDYSMPGSSPLDFLDKNTGVDLPDSGIKLGSPAWQADSLPLSHEGSSLYTYILYFYMLLYMIYVVYKCDNVYIYIYTHTHKFKLIKPRRLN